MNQQVSSGLRRSGRLVAALASATDLRTTSEHLFNFPLRNAVDRNVLNVVIIPKEGRNLHTGRIW